MKKIWKGGIMVGIILIFVFCKFNIVMSGSMEPVIQTGSLAIITTHYKTIEKDDIILYRLQDMQVLHRIVEINDDGIITKGDANDSVDFQSVSNDQVVGKYLLSIPLLGYFLFYMKKYILIVLVSYIFLILWRKNNEL